MNHLIVFLNICRVHKIRTKIYYFDIVIFIRKYFAVGYRILVYMQPVGHFL
jgi:hypothetical protein